jgi:hypothetical protein
MAYIWGVLGKLQGKASGNWACGGDILLESVFGIKTYRFGEKRSK